MIPNPFVKRLEKAQAAFDRLDRQLNRHRETAVPGTMITGRSGVPQSRIKKIERGIERELDLLKAWHSARRKVVKLAAQVKLYDEGKINGYGQRMIDPQERARREERRRQQEKIERAQRRKMSPEEALFVGVYPCGLVLGDRSREVNGDYMKIGFISYRRLVLEDDQNCSARLRPLVEEVVAEMQAKRGERYDVDACGRYVILGGVEER